MSTTPLQTSQNNSLTHQCGILYNNLAALIRINLNAHPLHLDVYGFPWALTNALKNTALCDNIHNMAPLRKQLISSIGADTMDAALRGDPLDFYGRRKIREEVFFHTPDINREVLIGLGKVETKAL